MNMQNGFLTKNAKRGSNNSNSNTETRLLANSRQFFASKKTPSQSKYKGQTFIPSNNSIATTEKKPIFRITSMTQNLYTSKPESEEIDTEIRRSHFSYQMVIGKGGFGKVWIVEHRKSSKYYALKEMSKAKVISKRSVHSVLNERT